MRRPGAILLLTLTCMGCLEREPGADGPDGPVLVWDGPLVLEENDSVFVAEPVISPDPAGGLIVSDRQQRQVRLHAPDGRLNRVFGREGAGPAEFEDLVDATRGADGRLFVLDREGRLSIWTADGDSLLRLTAAPSRGSDLTVLGDRAAVLATPLTDPGDLSVPVVHLIESDGSIGKAFLEPHVNEANAFSIFTVQGPSVEGLGGLKAVTIPVFDTIWVVDAESATVSRKLRIPSVRLAERLPPIDARDDRAGFFEWLQNTWFVHAAHPVAEGGWLVVLWHAAEEGADWALVRLDAEGDLEWEIGGVPELLTLDSDGRLIFDDPESILPNELRVARLRSGR